MNRCLCIFLFILYVGHLFAQRDSIKDTDDGEIRLSKNFLQELDNAFSSTPIAAPVTYGNGLTIEQLHEWVGKPDTVKADTSRFTKEYFALKIYLKEFCKPIPLGTYKIYIPGITDRKFTKGIPSTGIALDVNALGAYLRPKEIRIRKLRELAEENRTFMDQFYPMTDLTLYTKKDADSTSIFQRKNE